MYVSKFAPPCPPGEHRRVRLESTAASTAASKHRTIVDTMVR
jgi:hypothetical protein